MVEQRQENHIGQDTDIRAIKKILEVVDFQVNTAGEKHPGAIWGMAQKGADDIYKSEGHNIVFADYFKLPKLVNALCLLASTDSTFRIGDLQSVLRTVILPGMKIPNPEDNAKVVIDMVNDWRREIQPELFNPNEKDREAEVKRIMMLAYRYRKDIFSGSHEAAMDPNKKLESKNFDELVSKLNQEKELIDIKFYTTDVVNVYHETIKKTPDAGEKLLRNDDILSAVVINLGIVPDKNDTARLVACMGLIRRQVLLRKGTSKLKTRSIVNRLVSFLGGSVPGAEKTSDKK